MFDSRLTLQWARFFDGFGELWIKNFFFNLRVHQQIRTDLVGQFTLADKCLVAEFLKLLKSLPDFLMVGGQQRNGVWRLLAVTLASVVAIAGVGTGLMGAAGLATGLATGLFFASGTHRASPVMGVSIRWLAAVCGLHSQPRAPDTAPPAEERY